MDCSILKLIIALSIWSSMSFVLPPISGILGDIFYRYIIGQKLKRDWGTYFISGIPGLGPIISFLIIPCKI
jgi:hypothetical protein